MIESEILEKLQGTSIEKRIQVIEAILRTVKSDMRPIPSQQVLAGQVSLKGKVIRYEEPLEPVAVEDWETLS